METCPVDTAPCNEIVRRTLERSRPRFRSHPWQNVISPSGILHVLGTMLENCHMCPPFSLTSMGGSSVIHILQIEKWKLRGCKTLIQRYTVVRDLWALPSCRCTFPLVSSSAKRAFLRFYNVFKSSAQFCIPRGGLLKDGESPLHLPSF